MAHLAVDAEQLEAQVRAIFKAWGLPAEQAEASARILVGADLAGIESHGVGLLTMYSEQIARGAVIPNAPITTAVERGAIAVLDGGGGFGHLVSLKAADLAAEKAAALGVGAVAVRNSHHFGAAGLYARHIAERGLLGFCTTAVWRPAIVPTDGREPMLGTNPIAFAAPAARNRPFLLDMATSTAAIGKMRVKLFAGQPVPEGWAFDEQGNWERDPTPALAAPKLSPLGGDEEHGGHKGYGLAAMVEILSTTLAGATFAPLRPAEQKTHGVGHFFLALAPDLFRPDGGFESDLDALLDALRGSAPLDEARPVQVAGDPEYRREAERRAKGIPLPSTLVERLREIASQAGAPFLLSDAGQEAIGSSPRSEAMN
ncbi:Ldh family oxidoreductase [Aquibaculum arenosum]|uniref:Ldh family oxidoreductase n=1 Tax=Aquibaculum arenosum TaxID=3032591 RepID=A0ABT5YHJ4_9PROT|nr:Ldh family oxidoreductase [Fodinicurvata sp. CAU 1616]MDF2094388.1 Ldh family oxidoreductase [Fodinicurvata sp. CAU 1616]